MTYALDHALELERLGDDHFRVDAARAYMNIGNRAFGGWAVALSLKAVRQHPDQRGDLISLNAVFPVSIKAGPVEVRVRQIRQGRRIDFWRAEVSLPDGKFVFTADIVLGERSDSDLDYRRPPPPETRPIEECAYVDTTMGPPWLQKYEQHGVVGTPFAANPTPRNVIWMREKDRRPMDELGLVTLSDVLIPRTFLMDTTLRMASTLSYSFQACVGSDEIAALGDAPILIEGISDCVADSLYDQRGRLWSEDGRLLALTNQTAAFR